MTEFVKLTAQVSELQATSLAALGSNEVGGVSLEEPNPPLDELYFTKVVVWCYAFLFETGVFLSFSRDLLRRQDPGAFRLFNDARNIVRCARTVQTHNLRDDRESDVKTKATYRTWLVAKGGEPPDWELCIRAMIDMVCTSLKSIEDAWKSVQTGQWSRDETADAYFLARRNHWEAHEFDRCVESAADEIGLAGLDCVRFRESDGRLDRCRKLVSLFDTRTDAREAVQRAIRRELSGLFGDSS